MQINGQHAVSARLGNEVGDQFRGDRRAGAGLPVLARIAEIGQNGSDALGRGAAQRVNHDEQFHQIVVGGMTGRLNDKHVFATDIFVDFDENFIVGKPPDAGIGQRQVHVIGNTLCERQVAVACHQFHVCVLDLWLKQAHP